RPIFVVLDECRLFGKCDLVPLAIKGREARAALVISFQDVNGVEVLLGEKEAHELLGNILSKCFLAADSERATKWSSENYGKEEGWEDTKSVTRGRTGGWGPTEERIAQRELMTVDEFRNLALASWETGVVEGCFKSPFSGRYRALVPFREVVERLSPQATFPKYTQRPAAEQLLR